MTRARTVITTISAVAMGVAFATAARADRLIDPDTLPPGARSFALRGPLYDRDPYGRPALAGCTWSRIQVPTARGLRWVLQEQCSDDRYWR
jgi:hypothetical protein